MMENISDNLVFVYDDDVGEGITTNQGTMLTSTDGDVIMNRPTLSTSREAEIVTSQPTISTPREESFINKISCETTSNAFEKSRKTASTPSP